MFETFARELDSRGITTATGVFGAHMAVDYVNDGPVTLIIDSRRK
ncbi:MAG: D-aminoacyl-tRNA deacylase [Spirochaetales bacterium]